MTWLSPALIEFSYRLISVYDCFSLFCSSSKNEQKSYVVNSQNKENRFLSLSEPVTACAVHPLNGTIMAGTKVCGLEVLFLWLYFERDSLTCFITFINCLLHNLLIVYYFKVQTGSTLARYLGTLQEFAQNNQLQGI